MNGNKYNLPEAFLANLDKIGKKIFLTEDDEKFFSDILIKNLDNDELAVFFFKNELLELNGAKLINMLLPNVKFSSFKEIIEINGVNFVRNIFLILKIMDFIPKIKFTCLNNKEYLQHLFSVGVTANLIVDFIDADFFKKDTPDVYFLSGMVQDLGRVIFELVCPLEFKKAIAIEENPAYIFCFLRIFIP